jgi:hypothetical protein
MTLVASSFKVCVLKMSGSKDSRAKVFRQFENSTGITVEELGRISISSLIGIRVRP